MLHLQALDRRDVQGEGDNLPRSFLRELEMEERDPRM